MHNVYLAQFNITYGGDQGQRQFTYVPYSVGTVWASASNSPEVRDHFRLAGVITEKQDPEQLAQSMINPAVFAVSVYVWNVTYSLEVCRVVKRQHPECTIVMGGPSVPDACDQWLLDHPWVDVVVQGEGETAFTQVMQDLAQQGHTDPVHRATRMRDLTQVPSPYQQGVFDQWVQDLDVNTWSINAVLETNRGCPFGCTYCDWGSATLGKVACFDQSRIREDIEWMALNRVEWVQLADANFGAFRERDAWVADQLIAAKQKWGWPRLCNISWHKSQNDHMVDIADRLIAAGMLKEYTASLQSQSATVLAAIKRRNITDEQLDRIKQLGEQRGFAIHTELITPLPGETVASITDTMETLTQRGIKFSLFPLQILVNAEMAQPHYREKHGLVTHTHTLAEPHPWTKEQEEHVIETNTMTRREFEQVMLMAMVLQMYNNTGFTNVITRFLHRAHSVAYTEFMRLMMLWFETRPQSVVHQHLAPVWNHVERRTTSHCYVGLWNVPQYNALCTTQRDQFYQELQEFVSHTWPHCEHVADVFALQQHSQIHSKQPSTITITLASNLWDYVIHNQPWTHTPHQHIIQSPGMPAQFASLGHFRNFNKSTGRYRTNITCQPVHCHETDHTQPVITQ